MLSWIAIGLLGFVAGFIGTNTGGSSLLVTPLLIMNGLSPSVAIATARVGSLGTMLAGYRHFHRAGKIDFDLGWRVAGLSVLGTLLGAPLIAVLPPHYLKIVLAYVSLVALGLLVIRRRGLHVVHSAPWMKRMGFAFVPLVSGVGSLCGGQSVLMVYIFVFLFGRTFTEAAGTRKVVGLCTATVSVLIFGLLACVDWPRGVALALSTSVGSHFGARFGLRWGDKWVARAFYGVAALSALRLLFPL